LDDWIEINKDPQHIAREKLKAKKLRQTQWWKSQIATGICHYCKQKFKPEELTLDHIVPLSRGGKSTKGNVIPCCKACNNQKKYLTPVEIIMNQMNS